MGIFARVFFFSQYIESVIIITWRGIPLDIKMSGLHLMSTEIPRCIQVRSHPQFHERDQLLLLLLVLVLFCSSPFLSLFSSLLSSSPPPGRDEGGIRCCLSSCRSWMREDQHKSVKHKVYASNDMQSQTGKRDPIHKVRQGGTGLSWNFSTEGPLKRRERGPESETAPQDGLSALTESTCGSRIPGKLWSE